MRITQLQRQDIDACRRLYNYYVENTCISLEEQPLTPAQYEARAEAIVQNYPFLVARDAQDAVVGFAYLSEFNARSAYRCSADLSIYVEHAYRRAHVGTALLHALEDAAAAQGIRNLVSIITSDNDASRRFHEENGFVKEGELHDIAVKFGKMCSVCFYRKALRKESLRRSIGRF